MATMTTTTTKKYDEIKNRKAILHTGENPKRGRKHTLSVAGVIYGGGTHKFNVKYQI